jgi:hypothetical protein
VAYVPSPNVQAQDVGDPLDVSVNWTASGACPEVGDAVNAAVTPVDVTVNPFGSDPPRPPGFVTTTFQLPVAAVDGNATWQVIFVEEGTTTFVAAMSGDPVRVSLTVAPAWKPVPVRFVMATVDPEMPVFGDTAVTVGDDGGLTVI